MALPGFTAEISLTQATGQYRTAERGFGWYPVILNTVRSQLSAMEKIVWSGSLHIDPCRFCRSAQQSPFCCECQDGIWLRGRCILI
jgi:hypothetical protein